MPSEKPWELLTGMPATSEQVKIIWASALKVQMTEVTLAILIARVYAGCCWASSGGRWARRAILVHGGKIISSNIRAPEVSVQGIWWMTLVAGRGQRGRAPGSESS